VSRTLKPGVKTSQTGMKVKDKKEMTGQPGQCWFSTWDQKDYDIERTSGIGVSRGRRKGACSPQTL